MFWGVVFGNCSVIGTIRLRDQRAPQLGRVCTTNTPKPGHRVANLPDGLARFTQLVLHMREEVEWGHYHSDRKFSAASSQRSQRRLCAQNVPTSTNKWAAKKNGELPTTLVKIIAHINCRLLRQSWRRKEFILITTICEILLSGNIKFLLYKKLDFLYPRNFCYTNILHVAMWPNFSSAQGCNFPYYNKIDSVTK